MNELEKSLLSSLIMRPAFLESSDIKADDFTDSRHREVFYLVSEIWEMQRPKEIDIVILAEKMKSPSSLTWLSSLLDGQAKTDSAIFNQRLIELRKKNLSVQILSKIVKQAKSGALSLEEIEQDWEAYRQLSRSAEIKLISGEQLAAVDLQTSWLLEGFIAERSITVLHGPGGVGKAWLALQLGEAVANGAPIWNLGTTAKSVVYVDFENPLSLLTDRVRDLQIKKILFWHLSRELPPPRLDSDNFSLYRNLPKDSLIIFDSLRAGFNGDENSSQNIALIMNRLKELREAGFTILLLHHSPKSDETKYKRSTAISDLADCLLSLHRVKPGTFKEIEEDCGPVAYYLGTDKTRYEPAHIFLKKLTNGRFVIGEDPEYENLRTIAEIIKSFGHSPNQTEIFEKAKAELLINSKRKLCSLLKKGEGKFWRSSREGYRRVYAAF